MSTQPATISPPVDFLWLELTNQCNLQCTHCYAESGPRAGTEDILSSEKYESLILEAFALGCRQIQFIGGEPTLNRDLLSFIELASETGYEQIEVYTNLTRLSDEMVQSFIDHNVRIATSVYAAGAPHHDQITQVDGSFERTIKNVQRLVQAGIPVRAGITEMSVNEGQTAATIKFLNEAGVMDVRADRLRHFGRGATASGTSGMTELCGSCASGTLCVSPSGLVSPCIMSKQWSVGSVLDSSLSELASGQLLHQTRRQIHDATAVPLEMSGQCQPCSPHSHNCSPCSPNANCNPTQCKPYTRPCSP